MTQSEIEAQLRRQLAAFSLFTSRSLGKTDLDSVMLDACLRARAGTGVTHAKLLEYLPDRDRLIIRAGVGWKDGYVGQYSVTTGLGSAIGRAFTYSQPVPISDYRSEKDVDYPSILKEHGCISSVNVPITTEDGPFGILEVDHVEPRSYSNDDVMFLAGLGNTVAQAIHLRRNLNDLNRLLEERQLFAREMNHRIKNNLSLVAAMLNLQSRRNPVLRRELSDATQRINNLALVHDRMQLFTDMKGEIAAEAHFRDLAGMLRSLLPPGVALETECSGLILANCLESLTLIANELVTNAAKYAFEGRDTGRIELGYRQEGPGWRLWVKDNGSGTSSENATQSFGTQLIGALASRVNAQIHRSGSTGTCVELVCGVEPRS